MLFHKHVLIRAFTSNAPIAEEVLNNWLTDLVAKIDMRVVVPARSKYVDTPGNEGLTGSVNIETSHCAIHLWTSLQPQRIELDVYSCKNFELDPIIEKLKEWGLTKIHYMLVDRNEEEFFVIKQDTLLF